MSDNEKNSDFTDDEINDEEIGADEKISDEEIESTEEKEEDLTERLSEENKRLKDEYLRAFAELENTKRRCRQEIEKNSKFAVADFAKNLLGVADNLQRAIDAASKEEGNSCEGLLKGVELTQNELTKVFAKFNIKKMDILDTIFDPNFHQVIQEVPDASKPNGTIVAEIQTGYMIGDRILREAMVVVTKA